MNPYGINLNKVTTEDRIRVFIIEQTLQRINMVHSKLCRIEKDFLVKVRSWSSSSVLSRFCHPCQKSDGKNTIIPYFFFFFFFVSLFIYLNLSLCGKTFLVLL